MLTQAGLVVGSPGFMSPEQATGYEVGPPSDIFNLGAVLAFAATGEGPFGTGTTAALLYRVVHGNPSLDLVPPTVRPLIEHCLAKDPGSAPPPTACWPTWAPCSRAGTGCPTRSPARSRRAPRPGLASPGRVLWRRPRAPRSPHGRPRRSRPGSARRGPRRLGPGRARRPGRPGPRDRPGPQGRGLRPRAAGRTPRLLPRWGPIRRLRRRRWRPA